METLRRMEVDIREGVFSSGAVIATGLAREYMLNQDEIMMENEENVLYLRSDLENEMAEWLSDNEVPFAYEPLNIPGTFVDNDEWSDVIDRISDPDNELMDMWEEIYMKHNLDEEGNVGVKEGIKRFNKKETVPDFTIYQDEDLLSADRDWDEWGEFDYMVEVAGPYGAGIIPSGADWEDWYRVSGVAYKELLYRVLGIWDDVIFVVPNSDSVGPAVRADDNYVVVNSTQQDSGLDAFGELIGVV
jgi:hypothetical protein